MDQLLEAWRSAWQAGYAGSGVGLASFATKREQSAFLIGWRQREMGVK